MSYDISDLLEVAPDVAGPGVTVHGFRMTHDEPFDDGDFRHAVTVGLEKRSGSWPRGEFWVHAYDAEGLLLARDELQVVRTSKPGRRQLTGSFYASGLVSAELLFLPGQDLATGPVDDGWSDVPVRVLANDLGLRLDNVVCQARTDFEYSNLVVVQLGCLVVRDDAAAFPVGLRADWTLFEEGGGVVSSGSVEVASRKPRAPRPLHVQASTYQHLPPAWLAVDLRADEEVDLPSQPMSPAHGAALLALLRTVDGKLDRLLERG